MSDVPVWMLDVDGVLNAWDGTSNLPRGYVMQRCNGYRITYRPDLITRLRKMHDDGLAEIRWLTTWGSMANEHLGPIGVPTDLVVAAEPGVEIEYEGVPRWWKLTAVMALRDAEPDRWVVWTDDDIKYDSGARMWLESEEADDVLAISPSTSVGLTDDDLDLIEAFLGEWRREHL